MNTKKQPFTSQTKSLLDGIKVLDLSRILAGPWATQMLADYGATVWKIEKPHLGDDTRSWGPPFLERDEHSLSAYFISANRGKHSLAIDITKPEGQNLLRMLAEKADILVENFKVGGLKQYALDYDSIAKINPQLIYCSITGFGQTGPMARQAGYDAMIQAAGGLMSITGLPDEEQGEPQKVGVAVADLMTGMYASSAILAALNNRHITGQGQHIDLALFDSQLAMLANQASNYLVSGDIPKRQGNSHPNIAPYRTYECMDDHLMLAVGNDIQFKKLCQLLQMPQLAEDSRFSRNVNRVNHRAALDEILSASFKQDNRDNWLTKLTHYQIPCGPVNNIAQALSHEQAKARGMLIEIAAKPELVDSLPSRQPQSDGATAEQAIPMLANPVKFSNNPLSYNRPPPILGIDTEQILTSELGLTKETLEQLKKAQVFG